MEHNYLKKVRQLHELGLLPLSAGLNHVLINHDDWCALLTTENGHCDCDPDIEFENRIIEIPKNGVN